MTSSIRRADPGWYPDAYAPGGLRWFDGAQWTAHTRLPPPPPPAGAAPYGAAPHGAAAYSAAPHSTAAYSTAPHGSGPGDLLHWVAPVGRRGWAIAAGYVAIFAAFFWPLAPVALGMGIWALVDISRHDGHGRGRAWFAVTVGVLGTVLLLLILLSSTG